MKPPIQGILSTLEAFIFWTLIKSRISLFDRIEMKQILSRGDKTKKLLRIGIVLLIMAIALGPSQVRAFNSATHIYIADHVFPFASDKIDLYYGSIAPDLSIYIPYDPTWSLDQAFMDTHYYSVDLPYGWWKPTPKGFLKGWKTHNEIWGADFYGHGPLYHRNPDGSYTVTGYDGYVIKRAEELILWESSSGFDLDPGLAHFAVEVAIDLLLLKNDDPGLGNKLLEAALYRSQEDMTLLSIVFSEHETSLYAGESFFRGLVFSYATALIEPNESLRIQALGTLGAEIAAGMRVTIDSTTVQKILTKAISLCEQPDAYYMNIITEAINGISKEKTHPGHKNSGL